MKKIFLLLSILFLGVAVYADGTKTCSVSGTDGTVEVSVNVTDAESGTCVITFSHEQEEYNTQVHAYNTSLDQFCKSLYAMGKRDDAKAFLNLLKPDYNGSTAKINKIKSQYR